MPISVECCWVCYFTATSVANRALLLSRPCDMQGTAAPHFDMTAKMISNHLGQISSNPISLCKPCSDTIEASCLNNLCFCRRCKLLFVLDKNNSSSSARRIFFLAVLARKPGKTLFARKSCANGLSSRCSDSLDTLAVMWSLDVAHRSCPSSALQPPGLKHR